MTTEVSPSTPLTLTAGGDDDSRRIDRILRRAFPALPLSLLHRLIRKGRVSVDGRAARPGLQVRAGSAIVLAGVSGIPQRPAPNSPGIPDLDAVPVLARGGGIVIYDKPAGIAVHGPGSLDLAVKAQYERAVSTGEISRSLSFRPGPLHRLDKPTSGAVAFSQTLEGARLFSDLMRRRLIVKTYLAVLEGRINASAGDIFWHDLLARDGNAGKTLVGRSTGGTLKHREAGTAVKVIAANGGFTLAALRIVTGRTHQIRAQASSRGHPLAGDVKYGGKRRSGGLLLHALRMDFAAGLPGLPAAVTAPLPPSFCDALAVMFPDLAFAGEEFGVREGGSLPVLLHRADFVQKLHRQP